MRVPAFLDLRLIIGLLGAFLTHAALAQTAAPVENVSSFPPRTPREEQKALHLPPGFEIQLVASEPDIHKPLNIAFDDRGRLWVTDTLEYPFPKPENEPGRDSVKILSDFRADGRAGKVQTFADGLNIPIGLLPYPSGREAIVHNIPNIYLMRDNDGDGRADERKVLYGLYGHQDTHGMTNAFSWGFDGWIYACHGFANSSKVQGSDHKPIEMNSGNTYRMKPDGSHAEYVTHGQVNPFGLAFDTLGNLYSCDCHSRPVYQLLKGAWYPSFGKPSDGLGFGPEMVTHDHGSTGIAGISIYEANQFPPPYQGAVFIGNVVTNRINSDKIEWHGTTPKGIEQPDFVWSEDNWFRPVDIELGPDGALYIADFYNAIIGHYEVPLKHPKRDRDRGRIWRIVYRGEKNKANPEPPATDRTLASNDQLITDLGHPNLPVRMTAANQLVAHNEAKTTRAIRKLVTSTAPARQRVHALWVLNRIRALDDNVLLACASDSDRELRVHSMKVLVDRTDLPRHFADLTLARLNDADPFVRRAAAEVAGAHPRTEFIKPLLALRQSAIADDTHLIHVVRMALRDQLNAQRNWPELGKLELSERDLRDIADVALGVHNAESAHFVLTFLERFAEPLDLRKQHFHHVARYAPETMARLVALAQANGNNPAEQLQLVKAVREGAQERGGALDPGTGTFVAQVAEKLLSSARAAQVSTGIDAARDFQLRDLQPALRKVARRTDLSEDTRMQALAALTVIDAKGNLADAIQIVESDTATELMRERTAELLSRLGLIEASQALFRILPAAPKRIQTAIAAGLARRPRQAEALLDTIASGKASARLLQERSVIVALEVAGIPDIKSRIEKLLQGLPPADQRLGDLMAYRRKGYFATKIEASSGAPVFEKNCAVCHQLGGKGARVGPQLDGIGSRGFDRLIEDVLDPNRNVDQTFRTTNLALDNGRIVSGLLLREEGQVLIVADAQGKEVRVSRDSVENRHTSPLSPMPANFADQIPENDFYRLIAYLLSKRESPKFPAAAVGPP